MKRILGMLFILVLAASLGPLVNEGPATAATQPSTPRTWYVAEGGAGVQDGSDQNNAFPTIQQAIDVAGAGDTIMVAAGQYDNFMMKGKSNISIVGAKGATVVTTNLYTALPVVGNAWVMAAVYDSQGINIKSINFNGARVGEKGVCVGIAYVDSTGRLAGLTVENVVSAGLGAGVAIIGYEGSCVVEMAEVTVSDNARTGIYVCGGSTLEAHFSTIFGNSECGLLNDGEAMVDATYNWWGHASGPLHQTNPLGKGNAIVGDVDFKPWLGAAPAIVKTERITNGTVDARAEADTEVLVDGTATVTITNIVVEETATSIFGKYAGSLHLSTSQDFIDRGTAKSPAIAQAADFEPLNIIRDVKLTDTTPGTETEIRLYYTNDQAQGFDEASLCLFWHNGSDWVKSSDSGVNTTDVTIDGTTYSGYMYARVTDSTSPSVEETRGTPWGGYGHPQETPRPCGCFIATAAYSTDTAQEIDILRHFRDAVLLPNSLGAELVYVYNRASPPIAGFISQHEAFRTIVRVGFVDRIVAVLSWTHHLWSARGS